MPDGPVIGVDAGGTKVLAGVINEDLTVEHRVRRLWAGGDRDAVLATMVEAVQEASAAVGAARAVGFGIPSLVDFESGTSLWSNHLPLDGVPFRRLMAERLGLPVYVDNDTNLAALGELRAGAARGCRHMVMLTIGTGIGGGIAVDGRLMRGAGGLGAELGHVTIDLDGPPCPGNCPNRGCLEAFVSGPALASAGRAAALGSPDSALARAGSLTGEVVTRLAVEGDALARSVLADVGEWLGVGLVGIVNTFEPEVVVVGGGAASAAGELLLAPARQVVAERALPPARERVRIVVASLGDDAGIVGAGAFALGGGQA